MRMGASYWRCSPFLQTLPLTIRLSNVSFCGIRKGIPRKGYYFLPPRYQTASRCFVYFVGTFHFKSLFFVSYIIRVELEGSAPPHVNARLSNETGKPRRKFLQSASQHSDLEFEEAVINAFRKTSFLFYLLLFPPLMEYIFCGIKKQY